MKKTFTLLLTLLLTCSVLASASSIYYETLTCPYSDVPESHWAHQDISYLSLARIINGYPDGTFRPEQSVKVGEFIKIVVQTDGAFSDYKEPTNGEHWSYQYVVKLNNIANFWKFSEYTSYETLERNITREEMAYFSAILAMAYNKNMTNLDLGISSHLGNIADSSEISETFSPYVNICIKYGIVRGYPDGTFKPKNELTRAEAAKIVNRVSDITKDREPTI